MQVSIIPISKVRDASTLFRFDAEYFQPKYLETEELIKKSEYSELRGLISVLTDYHANGSYEILRSNVELKAVQDYAHMIRTVDIERGDFENDIIYISENAYDFLTKTKVYGGEIIINKIGNAGRVYLIPPINRPTSLGMNQFMIRVNYEINNYYLFCYLSGKYGQNQLSQRITGAVPLSIDKESTRSVYVPLFSKKFQNIISESIELHLKNSEISKNFFRQAKDLLLTELGLNDWQPKHQLTFIKNFSDTIQAKRIDAEFFQPKYDEIINAIKAYKGGWDALGNLVDVKKSIEVGRGEYLDEGIPFVRVSNISLFELSEGKYISEQLYAELTQDEEDIPFEKSKTHQPQQGEILFSKDGSPGIAYYLKDKPQKMVVSGGILRLQSKADTINNEYLTLVLNSVLTQEQVKRDVGGSIILHWRPEQVKETIIPILPQAQQLQIQQKITESFELRKQSKQLLENAKRAVEIAIEQDESKAIQWLDAQLV